MEVSYMNYVTIEEDCVFVMEDDEMGKHFNGK